MALISHIYVILTVISSSELLDRQLTSVIDADEGRSMLGGPR
jgi:hypothetical protein